MMQVHRASAVVTAAGHVCAAFVDNTGAACRYFFPTTDEIKNAAEYRKRLNYLAEEEKYKNCLAKSKSDSPITSLGVPTNCYDIMMVFVMCGGNSENEINEMTARFNKYKKK